MKVFINNSRGPMIVSTSVSSPSDFYHDSTGTQPILRYTSPNEDLAVTRDRYICN